MRRLFLLLFAAIALGACQPPASAGRPSPSSTPRAEPTVAALPTPAPASPAPTAALIAPTEPPTLAPATAVPDLAPALRDQAAALLPAFQSDLRDTGRWNRYTIRAEIDPRARTLAGDLRVEYHNRDSVPLDRLYFHLYPNLPEFGGGLDVTDLTVDGQATEVIYEDEDYLLRVDLPRPLAPGDVAVVALGFDAQAPENASATFYGAFNKERGVLALASSYPIAAIARDGAWDIARPDSSGDFVNSETALYDVTLTAPLDWALVTTGVTVDEQRDGERQVARIVSGPQRDFMISAVQLARASAEADGTRINSYYQPDDQAGGQRALQTAANALRAFNQRYGRYPLAELDIVQIAATTFLGVEYPGVIMIERGLYDDPQGLAITVAHEVGHQWWYSLVGNDVQREAWLDEGLTSYSQVIYQEEVAGPEAAERELEGFRRQYQRAREAGRDAPIGQPTAAFQRNYVALVYAKAALFFQALREQIGEAAFDRFLHTYYERQRYGMASGDSLLASAESACACQLDRLYEDWILTAAPVELP